MAGLGTSKSMVFQLANLGISWGIIYRKMGCEFTKLNHFKEFLNDFKVCLAHLQCYCRRNFPVFYECGEPCRYCAGRGCRGL